MGFRELFCVSLGLLCSGGAVTGAANPRSLAGDPFMKQFVPDISGRDVINFVMSTGPWRASTGLMRRRLWNELRELFRQRTGWICDIVNQEPGGFIKRWRYPVAAMQSEGLLYHEQVEVQGGVHHNKELVVDIAYEWAYSTTVKGGAVKIGGSNYVPDTCRIYVREYVA